MLNNLSPLRVRACKKDEGTNLHGGASSGYFGSDGITVKITVADDRAQSVCDATSAF